MGCEKEVKKEVKKDWNAAIINLGCKVNKYEADAMKDKLFMAGFEIVEPEEAADVYIVNTCSVTNMAQRKSRQMLRRAKKRNPDAVVVAAGCYVNAEHDTLKNEEFLDAVVGNNCKKDIVAVIDECIARRFGREYYVDINRTNEYEEMGSLAASHMDHQRAYVKIQDGCNQFCSYCIIPYVRGRVRSRKAENILEEIRKLAKEGIKEFVLTGIHISSYGIDFNGERVQYDDVMKQKVLEETKPESNQGEITGLRELVKAACAIPEVKRIRLGSLEPRIITEEFLEELKQSDKFCPHFHLSLQSACNDTLKRMNRKYTVEEFTQKCEMIRKYFDKPAITTDVIVGFPGETEEEFSIALGNLKKLNLYEIHVFKYSVRAGTAAEKFPDQIPEEIKGERSDILLKLTAKQKEEYENAMKGYTDEVLIEEILTEEILTEENPIKENPIKETHADDKMSGSLKEVEIVEDETSQKNLENQEGFPKKGRYFTGHTKRYIKVKLLAYDDITNHVVKIRFI